MDSGREWPPEQCLLVRLVDLWYNLRIKGVFSFLPKNHREPKSDYMKIICKTRLINQIFLVSSCLSFLFDLTCYNLRKLVLATKLLTAHVTFWYATDIVSIPVYLTSWLASASMPLMLLFDRCLWKRVSSLHALILVSLPIQWNKSADSDPKSLLRTPCYTSASAKCVPQLFNLLKLNLFAVSLALSRAHYMWLKNSDHGAIMIWRGTSPK